MTLAVLTRALDDQLEALLAGENAECLVCGAPVEADDEGRSVECPACGSVLEEPPRDVLPGQLRILES